MLISKSILQSICLLWQKVQVDVYKRKYGNYSTDDSKYI